jgi:predicted methyltransferase
MLSRRLALTCALFAFCAAPALAQLAPSYGVPPIPDYLAKAIASPDRAEAMKARDGGRKPAEVFALSGIKPGDRVIEFGAFGWYDSTIISSVIGPRGRLYMYDLPYMQERTFEAGKTFTAAHRNSEHKVAKFDEIALPKGVDLVVFDMYYHDLKGKEVDTAKLNKAVFEALKPGGRVLIVDHRAEPGSGWRDSTTIHRMDTATIVEEMQAAGFQLAVNNGLFANPKDDKSKRVFEPTIRGGTDRSLFVFVKPRA